MFKTSSDEHSERSARSKKRCRVLLPTLFVLLLWNASSCIGVFPHQASASGGASQVQIVPEALARHQRLWVRVSSDELREARPNTRAIAPLFLGARPSLKPHCSSVFVSPQLLLTAAHCFDDYDDLPVLGLRGDGEGRLWALRADEAHLACIGGRGWACVDDRHERHAPNDIATVALDEPVTRTFLRLGRIEKDAFPHMYLIGFQGELREEPKVRLVCRAFRQADVPTYRGEVGRPFHGDSGGALVAIARDTRELVLLGVMFGGDELASEWWFSPVPEELPAPSGARGSFRVAPQHPSAFSPIPQCHQEE